MSKTLCFTGHRPNKLGGYEGPNAKHFQTRLHNHLARIVTRAVEKRFKTFISGGALGVDQIAAEVIIERRLHVVKNNIQLIIARPFPSQHRKWPHSSQAHFLDIITAADKVVDVSDDPYAPWKMQIRNEWMVDRSEVVIAVWDGIEKGGTWNCIVYARKTNKAILFINPKTLETKWDSEEVSI